MPRIIRRRESIESEQNEIVLVSESNNLPKKRKVTPKLLDGKFYELVKYDTAGSVTAKCLFCEKQINGKINSTGNYWDHIRRAHIDELQKVRDYVKIIPTNVEIVVPSQIAKVDVSTNIIFPLNRITFLYCMNFI